MYRRKKTAAGKLSLPHIIDRAEDLLRRTPILTSASSVLFVCRSYLVFGIDAEIFLQREP